LNKVFHNGPKGSTPLATELLDALATWSRRATILLARRDNTALAFADAARPYHGTLQMLFCETDSHSFAHPQDAEWLEQQIVAALSRLPEAG